MQTITILIGLLASLSAFASVPRIIVADELKSGDLTSTYTINYSALNALSGGNTGDITIATANGLSLSGQALSLQTADATHTGSLTSADWSTFNSAFHLPSFTAGSVIFSNGTTLAEDNTGFFYDAATQRLFMGSNASIAGSNAGIQYSNATTANRGQIKLHSYFNGASVAGVSTLTSKSGAIGTNSVIGTNQDYSKWTAQASATTAGSAPISGTFAFRSNSTINALTVPTDFHIQTTNLAGTLGDKLYITSEGLTKLPGYGLGIAHFDASGNITSSAVDLSSSDVTGSLPLTSLAAQAANTFIGNATGSSAVPTAISAATAVSLLPAFVGDTGAGGVAGIVPAPAAGSAEQGQVIGAGGTFVTPDTSKPNNAPFTYLTQSLAVSGNQKMQNVLIIQHAGNTYAIAGGGTTKTVTIYNVTNQSAPVLRGSITLSGTYGVCGSSASWPYVFVPASGARTLTVLNISDPNNPVVVGTPFSWAANTTSIYACSYANGLVFMAGQSHGLGILDVGNGVSGGTITAPVLAFDEGTLNGAGQICNPANSCKSFGVAVDAANSIVYSTDFSTATPWTYRQLKAYSYASSITSPTLLQSLTLPANTKPLAVTFNNNTHTAFVSDSNQNLYDVIDITNVSTGGMSYLSSFAPSGGRVLNASFAAIQSPTSNIVYSPGGSATLAGAIDGWDLSNRSSPVLINTVLGPLVPDVFGNIALDPRGGYIYAGAYGNGTSGSALDIFSTMYEMATMGAVTVDTLVVKNGITGTFVGLTPVSGETPSGAVNSSNVTFTLVHAPAANSLRLFIDGNRTTAFTLVGSTITMTTAPLFGQTLLADYSY